MAIAAPRGVVVEPPAELDSLVAAYPLEGPPRAIVGAIKRRRMPSLSLLAAEAIGSVAHFPPERAVVVPVPASRMRLAQRGFNPAATIAIALATVAGLELVESLRRLDRGRQRGRSRERRLASPPRFASRGAAPVCAVVVDDVITTGATMAAAAAELRAAGCEEVHGLAFAATP